nr:hypothetical protein [Variovorax boronicumulans]
MPWQVVAFLVLVGATGAWAWAPQHWHVAMRASGAGHVLVPAFAVLAALVYASMVV